MATTTPHQLLRTFGPGILPGAFQLGLALTENPELLDQIVDPACSWVGVNDDVLAGAWQMLGSLKRTDLASAFLGKLDLQHARLTRVVRPISLMNKGLRYGWLDFLEQAHPGSQGEKYNLLQSTMLPLLSEWMYGSQADIREDTAQAWVSRWLDVAGQYGEECRGFAANSGLSFVMESHTRSPVVSDRLHDVAHALVEGGAQLNEKRPMFYEQIDGVHDEAKINHPNRVHECLYRWQRYGHEGKNELAFILVTLGGSWRASMKDPLVADTAKVTLEDHPLIKRQSLKKLAVNQARQGAGKRQI